MLIIGPNPFISLHSPAQTTAHNPELIFHIMKSQDQTSVVVHLYLFFWKIMFKKWSSINWIFNLQKNNFEIDFCTIQVVKITWHNGEKWRSILIFYFYLFNIHTQSCPPIYLNWDFRNLVKNTVWIGKDNQFVFKQGKKNPSLKYQVSKIPNPS